MKIKINHNYGQTRKVVINQDRRFNKRIWCDSSDPRINTKKLRSRASGVKQSVSQAISAIKRLGAIAFCLYLIAFLCWNYAPKETKQVTDQVVEQVSEQVEAREIVPTPEPTIEDKIKLVFGDKGDEAIKVFTCESNLNPKAVSRTFDLGVAQINYKTWNKVFGDNLADYQDIDKNLNMAKYIYDRSNSWQAWSSSRKCHNLK